MSQGLVQMLADRGLAPGSGGVASFGDPDAEYAALRRGAGVSEAGELRLLDATGEENADFLHGQVTADVRGLGQGQGAAAMVLTAQGRAVAETTLWRLGDRLLLGTDAGARDALIEALERFLIADDCEFEEAAELPLLAVTGPGAVAMLATAGVEISSESFANGGNDPAWAAASGAFGDTPLLVLRRGDLAVPRLELFAALSTVEADELAGRLWRALEDAGATPCGRQALEVLRIESGRAALGVDYDDSRVALEARTEWAIHFAKGCYVGQEVIERAVSRGRINRRLCLLAVDDDAAISHLPGCQVAGGGSAEVVTSATVSPGQGALALAYLGRERAETGHAVVLERDGQRLAAARVLEWPRPRVLAGRTKTAAESG